MRLESGYEEGFEGYTDDPLISVAEEDAAEAAENETAEAQKSRQRSRNNPDR